jgi:hypothetical protein
VRSKPTASMASWGSWPEQKLDPKDGRKSLLTTLRLVGEMRVRLVGVVGPAFPSGGPTKSQSWKIWKMRLRRRLFQKNGAAYRNRTDS